MAGETRNKDFKQSVNLSVERDKYELVKNIVSIANSGGGELVIGATEDKPVGISEAETKNLDSARVQDLVRKHIQPAQISLGHDIKDIGNGLFVLTLQIDPSTYPIVISKEAFDSQSKQHVLKKGDIWIRHSTATEKIEFEDLRVWIEKAKAQALEAFKDRLKFVSDLPDGSELRVVTATGEAIDSPMGMLQNDVALRDLNSDHLIQPYYLNWLFLNRRSLKLSGDMIALLVGSSLRRSSTLFAWLLEAEKADFSIANELFSAVEASDRDKSDAARNLVDLGAIYLFDHDLKNLIKKLRTSSYAHFKEAASDWRGRKDRLRKIQSRIGTVTVDGELLFSKSISELEEKGDQIAKDFLNKKSNTLARKLADINIVLWAKQTTKVLQEAT